MFFYIFTVNCDFNEGKILVVIGKNISLLNKVCWEGWFFIFDKINIYICFLWYKR